MIKFEDKTHRYYDKDSDFLSVTSLLKKVDPTNWEEVKKKYADKHKMSIEDVDAKWNKAAEVGTYIHSCFENDTKERIECKTENGIKYALDIDNLSPGVYTEIIVYSHKYGIAGQIDKLIIHDDKTFSIDDYKSDESITMESYKGFKKVNGKAMLSKGEYFKHPLNKLELCKFSKYAMQLSIYARLLVELGYELRYIEDKPCLKVFHVITERDNMKNHKLVDGKPIIKEIKEIDIPYLEKESINLLNYKLKIYG